MNKYEQRRLALMQLLAKLGRGGQRQVAEKIGVEASYVSRLLYEEGKAGKKRIGEDIAEKLIKAFPLLLKVDAGAFVLQQEVAGYQVLNPDRLHQVPVVGRGMGGLPDRVFTDEGRPINGHDDYAEIYSSDPAAFLVRVEGNSMWPKYSHGDYALIEPATEPEIEDDVLLRTTGGEVMLKRLLSRRGGYMFGSYNEQATYSFDLDEIVWMYYVAHPVPHRKIKSRI